MTKTQVYLRDDELEALRDEAERSGRSVADLVRDAIRQAWLRPRGRGPVALSDVQSPRSSIEHDHIYDEP